MTDLRRVSLVAVILLVALRLAIGWQLLYEGLWKYNSIGTPEEWSAEGYLKNAVGPMRGTFRGMLEDPDDKRWANYAYISKQWDDWVARFSEHYRLSDDQKAMIAEKLEGSDQVVVPLRALPPGLIIEDESKDIVFSTGSEGEVFRIPAGQIQESPDADVKLVPAFEWGEGNDRLVVNTSWMVIPAERLGLEAAVKDRVTAIDKRLEEIEKSEEENADESKALTEEKGKHVAFIETLDDLATSVSNLGYRQRLRGRLSGNPELVTIINDEPEDSIYYRTRGSVEQYRDQLERYEKKMDQAVVDFQKDHLVYDWKQVQKIRSGIVNPIKALDKEFKTSAYQVLSTDQLTKLGPMPERWSNIRIIDTMTIGGLLILGVLLMCGFATRLAAIGAAVMLFSFYLAYPPLPGVPEVPGPEHAFIINKNLIEVIALLAIAALPTGSWFGIDALIGSWWRGRDAGVSVPKSEKTAGKGSKETPPSTASKT